jgi:hypothetical protein
MHQVAFNHEEVRADDAGSLGLALGKTSEHISVEVGEGWWRSGGEVPKLGSGEGCCRPEWSNVVMCSSCGP